MLVVVIVYTTLKGIVGCDDVQILECGSCNDIGSPSELPLDSLSHTLDMRLIT
jgi:hypothetical protein